MTRRGAAPRGRGARSLPRVVGRVPALLLALALATALPACTTIDTSPRSVAAVALDSVPFPALAADDSLRDSLGVARPLRATVFNPQGGALTGVAIRYYAADPGVRVDSVTGFVVADSARTTPVRVLAQAGGIQTAPILLYVVAPPDTAFAVTPPDSFPYSLRDTAATLSPALAVRVGHAAGTATALPVQGWLVSYRIAYPRDSTVAVLVGPGGAARTPVDTTGADGSATARVRLRPAALTSPTDTVVVIATARYRGAVIAGAPVRFRLRLAPSLH